MDCLVVRGPNGALCGYVAVTEGHPAFKADYNRVQVRVHGGLTYGNMCQPDGKICHVPRPGYPDHVYWLGFDCSHSGDLSPGATFQYGGRSLRYPAPFCELYRDLHYVISECCQLAEQLARREPLRPKYDWED
jgi:hypothetical protein